MARTNTAPPSGTRDFLPIDVLRRKYVVSIVERVYQSYGFEPLETPTMERIETLLGKYGEEGDQLIFRVMKRGVKLQKTLESGPSEETLADAGLRYDLTVPLARVASEYQNQLPRFFKRYQIQPVYRADRPAKGRFREFFQCDLDIVGSDSLVVESEVLNAAAEVLQELGFLTSEDFSIRLNHRGILRAILQLAGVAAELEESALIAVDKLDKAGLEGVRSELLERQITERSADALLELLSTVPSGNTEVLNWLEEELAGDENGLQANADLREVLDLVSSGPSAKHIRIDPYLARGLSYYTGPIFEIAFEGLGTSGGGGGRYDELIGMFLGRRVPACGFSLGLERIILIMEKRGLFPERITGQPEVMVTQFSGETVDASLKLARTLRDAGLRVDLYPAPGKYGKQFKYADQRQIRYVVLLGPGEIESGVVGVKDLQTGAQEQVSPEEIVAFLQGKLTTDG
jgi:histidyl-tRNA synthetase